MNVEQYPMNSIFSCTERYISSSFITFSVQKAFGEPLLSHDWQRMDSRKRNL